MGLHTPAERDQVVCILAIMIQTGNRTAITFFLLVMLLEAVNIVAVDEEVAIHHEVGVLSHSPSSSADSFPT